MMVDDGVVVREDDRWVVTGDLSSVVVPPSIQALLASRLDRLTPEERAALEAAAVVGKEFFLGAVRDLVDEDARVAGARRSHGARSQGADPSRAHDPSRRGRVPVPTPADP